MDDCNALHGIYDRAPRTMDARLEALCKNATPIPIVPAIACIVGALTTFGSLWWIQMWLAYNVFPPMVPVGPILLVVGLIWYRMARAKARAAVRSDVLSGPLVAGFVVEADPQLYVPGIRQAMVRLLYSLDPARRLDRAYLESIANGIRALKGAPQPAADLMDVWKMINDPAAFGTRLVPVSAAGNSETYLAIVAVKSAVFPTQRIESPTLPCIYLPNRAQLAVF